MRLYRLADDDHVLAVSVHHIAADGHSLGVLACDVVLAYAARAGASAAAGNDTSGVDPGWPELPVQYVDYTWRYEILGDETDPASEAARQLDYWTRTLAGRVHPLPLPTDRPRRAPCRPPVLCSRPNWTNTSTPAC